MVEHLHQNAQGIRKRRRAHQIRRPCKASRKVGMGGRSAVAQRAARYQTAGDYHLKPNSHNQQQQCRYQQHARDVARRIDRMGAAVVQKGAHKKADHARTDDEALVDNDLARRHKLGNAHVKKILASQIRKIEQRQAYNLPNAPTQVCGCVSHASHESPPAQRLEINFNREPVSISKPSSKCRIFDPSSPRRAAFLSRLSQKEHDVDCWLAKECPQVPAQKERPQVPTRQGVSPTTSRLRTSPMTTHDENEPCVPVVETP